MRDVLDSFLIQLFLSQRKKKVEGQLSDILFPLLLSRVYTTILGSTLRDPIPAPEYLIFDLVPVYVDLSSKLVDLSRDNVSDKLILTIRCVDPASVVYLWSRLRFLFSLVISITSQ